MKYLLLVMTSMAVAQGDPAPGIEWNLEEGRSLELRANGEVCWRFNFGEERGKPGFHPLALPGGRVLTVDAPKDHLWHHGLWFSWKLIDGVNFWEHDPKTGRPTGKTSWSRPEIDRKDDGSALITMDLTYAPRDGIPVLTEKRRIRTSVPAADASFFIDWSAEFQALADCKLDRTPPPHEPGGKSNGGYAGFSCRLVQLEERDARTSQGLVKWNEHERFRVNAHAFDYRGRLKGEQLGVAIIDHSTNSRTPSPWYSVCSSGMTFFTPAVLGQDALSLSKGESFRLAYRVHVHPGRWSAEQLEAATREFHATPLGAGR